MFTDAQFDKLLEAGLVGWSRQDLTGLIYAVVKFGEFRRWTKLHELDVLIYYLDTRIGGLPEPIYNPDYPERLVFVTYKDLEPLGVLNGIVDAKDWEQDITQLALYDQSINMPMDYPLLVHNCKRLLVRYFNDKHPAIGDWERGRKLA